MAQNGEKLTSTYSLRISENLKLMADKLSPDEKTKLNYRIRIEIARSVHNAQFDPDLYLKEV